MTRALRRHLERRQFARTRTWMLAKEATPTYTPSTKEIKKRMNYRCCSCPMCQPPDTGTHNGFKKRWNSDLTKLFAYE